MDNFLVPSYCNQPDVDDMYALKWSLHHYIKYFNETTPLHKISMRDFLYMCDLMILQYSELQCPFSRTFIRNIVKDLGHDSLEWQG